MTFEEDDAVDDLVGVLHFLDRLGPLLLCELCVAPIVEQAVVQPVLIDRAQLEKQRFVELLNDLGITLIVVVLYEIGIANTSGGDLICRDAFLEEF